jgi:PKD repeat protein
MCADADADACGTAMDLSGYTTATLDFIAAYNYLYGDYFDVDVSSDGGDSWTNVLHWHVDHSAYGPGAAVSIDLTPYQSAVVVVRFHYFADSWDYYAEVDQVRVTGVTETEIQMPVSWDQETDEDGYYQVWMDEYYSPVTVTVTYPDHEVGLKTNVMVTGGMTTTEDFDLRWLQPCVSASPLSMEVTVVRGTSEMLTLDLSNDGAAPTPFEIQEQEGTVWPPATILVEAGPNAPDARAAPSAVGKSAPVQVRLPDGVEGGDVPWLDEDPAAGTLDADSHVPISVTFTAFPTMTGGVYTATLIAKTADPVNDNIDVPMTMTVVYAPVCEFTTSSPDDLGMATTFTNTTDEGYTPTTYHWDFGDGSAFSAATHPTHTYDLPGFYTAVLTAENPYGVNVCTDTVSVEGVVAGFTSNSPVILGEEMLFTNTTVANPDVVNWFWTFGDSGNDDIEHPTHTYAATGTYTVTLFAATVPGGPNKAAMPENVYDFYIATVEVLEEPCVIYLPIISK